MVKLIANMHGNEPVGRELMLALARYLLQNNGRDPRVTRIVEGLDIHILPSLNPDGFENATKGVCSGYHLGTGRHNGHLVDLNRAFPSWDNLTLSQEELTAEAEPEVAAIIDWVLKCKKLRNCVTDSSVAFFRCSASRLCSQQTFMTELS